jgi:hypothetical protein
VATDNGAVQFLSGGIEHRRAAMSAIIVRPAVFALIQAHRTDRDTAALAALLNMGIERRWGDAEGDAARGYLLESGVAHVMDDGAGGRVARWYPEIRPVRRVDATAAAVPLFG